MPNYEYYIAKNIYGAYAVPVSSSYTLTSKAILAGRVHEPSTIAHIIECCRGKDIIHAGSGFGDFLPALAKNCEGNIWTFEPNIENHYCARKTVELNSLSNVKLFNFGLGARRETRYLKVNSNNQPLGPRTETTDAKEPFEGSQSCEIHTLDGLISDALVSVIHLDVEGFEPSILNGARRLIEINKPIIILEIHGDGLKYNEFMRSIGYAPSKQLIYDAGELVFVNTVYAYCP